MYRHIYTYIYVDLDIYIYRFQNLNTASLLPIYTMYLFIHILCMYAHMHKYIHI